jgi:hypothetical protein
MMSIDGGVFPPFSRRKIGEQMILSDGVLPNILSL